MKKTFLYFFTGICLTLFSNAYAIINSDLLYRTKASKGETLSLTIPLQNETDKEMLIDFSKTDFINDAELGGFYETAPHHTRSAIDWIQLGSRQITIPPEGTIDFHYSVQIPKDLSLKGSYWAVILVEPSMTTKEIPTSDKDGLKIITKTRYAFLLVIDVGTEEPQLKLLKKELVTKEGVQLLVDVKNISGIMVRPRITSDLYTAEGKFVAKLETTSRVLLPDNSSRFHLDLSKINPDKYSAFLFLDCGDDGLFGDKIQIDIPKEKK